MGNSDDPREPQRSNDRMLRLINEASLAEAESARQAGALGFMARLLVQATMPHSRPKTDRITRSNGGFSIQMVALRRELGLPYGAIPRLILAWATTEVVRSKDPVLKLGANLTECLRITGVLMPGQTLTWGRGRTAHAAPKQIKALFSAAVSWWYDGAQRQIAENVLVARRQHYAWDPLQPDQTDLWPSTVELSPEFFAEIITRPVPIDFRTLRSLKKSPMQIDLYMSLTHRMSYLVAPTTIPWELLLAQYGPGYANNAAGKAHFKDEFKPNLAVVQLHYPNLRCRIVPAGLRLEPSPTHIPRLSR